MKTFLGALKSRTMQFNSFVFVIGILALPEFIALLPASLLPYITLVTVVGNMYLRTVTTESLAAKVK